MPYDIQFNNLLKDEYPNLVCKLVLHRTSSNITTNLLFIVVNIPMDDIHPIKGEIFGFLVLTDLNPNDPTTESVYEAVFQDRDPISDMKTVSVAERKTVTRISLLLFQVTLKFIVK